MPLENPPRIKKLIELRGDRVAIEGINDPDKIGHIWIPDQAKFRCDQGIVKYTGPECRWLEKGDYVLFSAYSGETIQLEDEGVFIIMREVACVCKIHPADTEVPGLYYRDQGGAFFPATHETVTRFIAMAYEDPAWREKYGIKARRYSMKDTTVEEEGIGLPDYVPVARDGDIVPVKVDHGHA